MSRRQSEHLRADDKRYVYLAVAMLFRIVKRVTQQHERIMRCCFISRSVARGGMLEARNERDNRIESEMRRLREK